MKIQNPLFSHELLIYQIFGMCSVLYLLRSVEAVWHFCLMMMGLVALTNLCMSLFRNVLSPKGYFFLMLFVIVSLVTILEEVLKYHYPEILLQMSWQSGVLITNALILGSAYHFARINKPILSFGSGLLNGICYSTILLVVTGLREMIGTGKLVGVNLFETQELNQIILLPTGGLVLIGLVVWLLRIQNINWMKD